MDCVFCEISAGTIPADIVIAGEDVLFFRDTSPQAPVHVLGIPRRHIPNAGHLGRGDGDLLGSLFGAFAQWAREENISSWRVVTNIGSDAGQSVDHLHFHFLAARRLGSISG